MGRRGTVGSVAGVLIALFAAGTAMATNWGGPRDSSVHCDTIPLTSQCVGENTSHSIYIESSVDAELSEEIVWSVANYTAVSDISMFISTSSSSDVKVRAVDYGMNGWWASTACEFAGSPTIYGGSETPLPGTRWCKAQVFRYNLFYRASKYPTDNNERSITCQELGHTIGLRHATSGTGDPDLGELVHEEGQPDEDHYDHPRSEPRQCALLSLADEQRRSGRCSLASR